tara:strand:- start:1255 stop:2250 length:996 start_codon:yes stop_codon:yes gene_type:complete
MLLGIENFLFNKFSKKGPYIFTSRLISSIKKQGLCNVTSTFDPRSECNLYLIEKKNDFLFKNFFLRVDGLYLDKFNTKFKTDKLNKKIFQSIEKACGLIFISEYCKRVVEKFYKKISLPNVVIHNAVDINEFLNHGHNLREKFGFKKDDRVIVTSASWRRHKRLDETIELLKILNNENKLFKYKLLVLGQNDEKKILHEDIVYTGHIPHYNLPSYYRSGDIYLHLAWIEPCGNTQIEAMSCGLPVICCNNGGIGETVKKADGGKVLETDEKFNFEKIDYYNPPKPKYNLLKSEIKNIFENLEYYKKKIKREKLDISITAQEYIKFISNTLK